MTTCFLGAQGRSKSADAVLILGRTSATTLSSPGAGACPRESAAAPGPLLFPAHWQGLADMETAAVRAQLAMAAKEWDVVDGLLSSALTRCEGAL